MTYVLGNEPRTSSEAFDALENVFGGEEFTKADAITVLETALELGPDEARNEFNRLLRSEAIEEAE